MDEVSNKLRETRLDLSKKVKTRKDEIRAQIVIEASKTFSDTVAGLGAHPVAVSSFRMNENRLNDSVKGKRSVEAMRQAVDKEVAAQLEEFNTHASLVSGNVEILKPFSSEYPSLFADERTLLVMPPTGLNQVIDSRIAQRKAEDETRRLKEEAKAKEEPVVEKAAEPPAQEPAAQQEPAQEASGFMLTVILDCDKEKAARIAQTLNNTMDAYGKSVKSINLSRINKQLDLNGQTCYLVTHEGHNLPPTHATDQDIRGQGNPFYP
ncbi:MAG: hypothetical protein PF495_13285 [Spirochaetales bacterium]|jgi:hypothetical protein|nr:hypothetical protein [Spirochaetales bacterium]